MQFTYRAKQDRHTEASGVIEAADVPSAVSHLRQMGLYPLEVVPLEKRAVFSRPPAVGHPLSRRELALLARTVAQGLSAGLSLTQVLHLLAEQEKSRPVGEVASSLERQVTAGLNLADAMAQMGRAFSPVAVNLLRAGEAGGALEQVLAAFASQMDAEEDLTTKVKGAFTYPLFVLAVGFGFMLFANWIVLPRLALLFQETGQPIPLLTRCMMGFVNALAWGMVMLLGAAAVYGWLAKLGKTTLPVGRWGMSILHRMPLFGRMIRQMDIARLGATLGLLLEHGLPLPESLRLVAETIPRDRLKGQILQARQEVVEGMSLSDSLRRSGMDEPFLLTTVTMGEAQGELGKAFLQAGLRYHEEVDRTIKVLSTLIEPMLILGVAILLGGVVIAMILPIFQINFTVG